MSSNLFHRYIWLADTIYRAGRITFAELNRRWLRNSMSEGKPIPLRTFHKHREAVGVFRHTHRLLQADQRILYRKQVRTGRERCLPLVVEQFFGQ